MKLAIRFQSIQIEPRGRGEIIKHSRGVSSSMLTEILTVKQTKKGEKIFILKICNRLKAIRLH